MRQFIAPDMVTVRLSRPFPLAVVANPTYLTDRAAPENPSQLCDYACLRWRRSNGTIAAWTFKDGRHEFEVEVNGPCIANDFPTLISAAVAGIGLAQIPAPLGAKFVSEGNLQPLLEPFAPLTPGVFLYHPGRHQVMPKLRAFIEHVKAHAVVSTRQEIVGDSKPICPPADTNCTASPPYQRQLLWRRAVIDM